jgi:hypothetical protein
MEACMSFHVVKEESNPPYLVSDWNGAPTQVECGAPTGQRRNAITYKDFNRYSNEGSLRVKNMCMACAKKLGIRVVREKKENVASE